MAQRLGVAHYYPTDRYGLSFPPPFIRTRNKVMPVWKYMKAFLDGPKPLWTAPARRLADAITGSLGLEGGTSV